MDWDEVTPHLTAPLSPDAIKPPPQGKYGEYVDGLHVIREANRIFGHDGWSYRITRLEMVSRLTTAKPQVRVGYLCTVEVTVDGVVREGSAVGSGMVAPDSEADAHESAVKEAETDAMKRALRTFGNTFGLALYDKDKTNREVGYAPVDQTEEVARLTFLIEQEQDGPALIEIKKNESKALDALTDGSFETVKSAFNTAKLRITPPPAGPDEGDRDSAH